jgi:hypothetical protein
VGWLFWIGRGGGGVISNMSACRLGDQTTSERVLVRVRAIALSARCVFVSGLFAVWGGLYCSVMGVVLAREQVAYDRTPPPLPRTPVYLRSLPLYRLTTVCSSRCPHLVGVGIEALDVSGDATVASGRMAT